MRRLGAELSLLVDGNVQKWIMIEAYLVDCSGDMEYE